MNQKGLKNRAKFRRERDILSTINTIRLAKVKIWLWSGAFDDDLQVMLPTVSVLVLLDFPLDPRKYITTYQVCVLRK